MEQLYVCSKPIPDENNNMQQHLLGILTKDENDYIFEYKLGEEFPDMLLKLTFFPDINKMYRNDEVRELLDEHLPSENSTEFIKQLLKKANMTKYDEWEWLKTFEPDDYTTETYLYETLSDNIICHNIDENKDEDINDFDDGFIDESTDDTDDFDDGFIDESKDEDINDFDDGFIDESKDEDINNFDDGFIDESKDEDINDFDDGFIDESKDTINTIKTIISNKPVTIISEHTKPIIKTQQQSRPAIVSISVKTKNMQKKSVQPFNSFTEPLPDVISEMQKRLKENQQQREEKLKNIITNNKT